MKPQSGDSEEKREWNRQALQVEVRLLNQMNREFGDELGILQSGMKGMQLSKTSSAKMLQELSMKMKSLTRQHALNGQTIATTRGLIGDRKRQSTIITDSIRHAMNK